ncbi:MAG: hypothetical protein ACFB10_03160 [Salibacteraceae bacterium]
MFFRFAFFQLGLTVLLAVLLVSPFTGLAQVATEQVETAKAITRKSNPVFEKHLLKFSPRGIDYSISDSRLQMERFGFQLSYEWKPGIAWSGQLGLNFSYSNPNSFFTGQESIGVQVLARHYYRKRHNLSQGMRRSNLMGSYFATGLQFNQIWTTRLFNTTEGRLVTHASIYTLRWGRQFQLNSRFFLDFNYGIDLLARHGSRFGALNRWRYSASPSTHLTLGYLL